MAGTAVNSLSEKLLQLVTDELDLIVGVNEVFQELFQQVRILSTFIEDYGKLVSDSTMWKEMDKDIRITVYKTEDVIDKFLVMAKLHQGKSTVQKLLNVQYVRAQYVRAHRELHIKIKGMIDEMKRIPEGVGQSLPPAEKLRLEIGNENKEPKDHSLEDDEVVGGQVVGFDEEAVIVIKRLIEGSGDLDVIPIVGMPGLGKTTLARKIYTDPQISYDFFNTIWIHVGQFYKIKDIFLQILRRTTEDFECMDANELAKQIRSYLEKGGRCLIVLDEVWDTEVVDSVMKVFPENNKGHRIMITTRYRHIARYVNEDPHNLKFLTSDESFELLRMKVFRSRSCPNELIGVAKSIAENCAGLPLSVVVIAGALRGTTDRKHWIQVENNVGKFLINTDDARICLKYVEMSYNLLPQEMQSCFLYCGVFPRGFDIPVWKLIRLWIAEGLIMSKPGITLEETAQYYLNDLVNRNLVMVMQKKCDGQIKTCRVQNMLHEFCKVEASGKWFFREVSPQPDQAPTSIHDPSTSRRLCIPSSVLNDFLSTRPFAEHVRSFYCFSTEPIMLSPADIKSLHKAFPLIRVLDVESLKFFLSRNFEQLFLLKYIAISGDFKALPALFGRFWNLQTLILNTSNSGQIIEIKADIWNLLRLRHIHTSCPARLPSPSTSRGKTSTLQTLSHVTPESCKKNVFAKACNLKKLSIWGQMDAFLGSNKDGYVNLEELKCLEELKLLNDFSVSSYKVLQLPHTFFRFVRSLKKLTLRNTRFDWCEAEKLGQLEFLEVLKLKESAFMGRSWKPEIGGFSQLQVLWIERSDLETLEASASQFPVLRQLVLIDCEKLEAVPSELAGIPNLREIRLINTGKAARSAKEIASKKLQETIKFELSIYPPQTDSESLS